MSDIEEASASDTPIAGFSLDLAKAFDNTSPSHAFEIRRRLGAPGPLLGVLSSFYASVRRHAEWRGAVVPDPVPAGGRGLLQGDPLAPLLLMAVMQTWEINVKSRTAADAHTDPQPKRRKTAADAYIGSKSDGPA